MAPAGDRPEVLSTVDMAAMGEGEWTGVLEELTLELDRGDLATPEALAIATALLSRAKAGTWVAMVMDDDPNASRVVVSDDANPAVASYINAYVASLDRPGRAPTTGLSREVIASGKPYVVPTMSLEQFFGITTARAREFFRAYRFPLAVETVGVLAVPMRSRGTTIGTLALFDWNARLSLSDADAPWVQAVADRIAASLEHARWRNASLTRLDRLMAMRSIGLTILSSRDLRLTLQIVLEQLSTRLKSDAADVLLVDESKGEVHVAAGIGFRSGSVPAVRLPVHEVETWLSGGGPRGNAASNEQWLQKLRHRAGFAREGFQTWHATALVSQDRLLGLIEVFHRSVVEVDQEWLASLDDIGTITAVALDNLSMHSEIQRIAAKPQRAPLTAKPTLSTLEWQILAEVVDGATNREIAQLMHLGESTVKFHVRRILDSVGARSRTELARKATQQGWV